MVSKKYESIMGWLALVVLIVMLGSVLFLPLIQGQNIGEIFGEVLNEQIYHEFEYDSKHDYYSYTNDEDTDDSYDDEEYRQRAEQEYKRIKRDIRHIEKFENSVSFGNEITLLTKYIQYASEVKERMLVGFRYSIAMVIMVVVMVVVVILYLSAMLIMTLINLLRRRADINKIQRRLCRSLFVLIPLIIALNWERLILYNSTKHGMLYNIQAGITTGRIGVGCILACAVLVIYLIAYWVMHVHIQISKKKIAERTVINQLLFFILMAIAGLSLLLNFTTALKDDNSQQRTSDVVIGSAFQLSMYDFVMETYEIEYEQENENDEDEKKTERWEEIEEFYEEGRECMQKSFIGGIFLLIGTIFAIQIFCSMNKAAYQKWENKRYLIWIIINLFLYIVAYFMLHKANSIRMDLLEDLLSKQEREQVGSLLVNFGVFGPILLNVFMLLANLWKEYINKFLDNKASALAVETEKLSSGMNKGI